jgi:hypothetical protein
MPEWNRLMASPYSRKRWNNGVGQSARELSDGLQRGKPRFVALYRESCNQYIVWDRSASDVLSYHGTFAAAQAEVEQLLKASQSS